jgi:hypothetical protein
MGPNMDISDARSTWKLKVRLLSSSVDNDKPFLRGLLKNAFMPALRQSFFVES